MKSGCSTVAEVWFVEFLLKIENLIETRICLVTISRMLVRILYCLDSGDEKVFLDRTDRFTRQANWKLSPNLSLPAAASRLPCGSTLSSTRIEVVGASAIPSACRQPAIIDVDMLRAVHEQVRKLHLSEPLRFKDSLFLWSINRHKP